MAVEAVTKKNVYASKSIDLTAGQKINIDIDGVEQEDLSYTVPAGKKITITVVMHGDEEEAS